MVNEQPTMLTIPANRASESLNVYSSGQAYEATSTTTGVFISRFYDEKLLDSKLLCTTYVVSGRKGISTREPGCKGGDMRPDFGRLV